MTTKELELTFSEAIYSGNVNRVRDLATSHPDLVRCDIDVGHTPLHDAARTNNASMIRALIEIGFDVNAEGRFTTPLEDAISTDNPDVVRLLLENKADPNRGRTLFSAIRLPKHSLEIIQLLEQYGLDLHRVFKNELTDPPQPMNALSFAIDWGNQEVVEYLKSKGAVLPTELPPDPPPTLEESIKQAMETGDVARVRQLLTEHPEQIHRPVRGEYGKKWIHVAVECRNVAIVELLIELGADVNAGVEHGDGSVSTPLNSATTAPVTRCLLEHGAKGKVVEAAGCLWNLECLRLLDCYGVDLHETQKRESDGEITNALKFAIDGPRSPYFNMNDVVEFLRFRGVTLPGEGTSSAQQYHGIMKEPDEMDWAIVDAVRAGDVKKVRQLLTEHPDCLHRFHYGHTWLQIAAHYNSVPMIELLIELGCDVNAEGINGFVALDAALQNDNPETARVLLEHGANPKQGKQVLRAIIGYGRHSMELIQLLEQYGADLFRTFAAEGSDTKKLVSVFTAASDFAKKDVYKYLQAKKGIFQGKKASVSARPANLHEEIIAFCTETFGPVEKLALIEIVPTEPAISIHAVRASQERNHLTLFTIGMSDKSMTVPAGQEDYQWAELFIQLPTDWPYRQIDDPNYGWPIYWLRSLAKHSHQNQTGLGGPVGIIANDDPPQPLVPNTRFTSLLYLSEKSFTSKDGRKIRFYRMAPLYTEERDLAIREDIGTLLTAFDAHNIPFVVDLNRPSVA